MEGSNTSPIDNEAKKEFSLNIRLMQSDDVCHGMRLSIAEGWNQTESDWKLIIENPANICVLAEVNGKVIGTTAAIAYANVTWIGMVLVDKEHRGLGVSKALLADVFARVAKYKSIKLDATPAGQRVYQKFGFRDEYFIARMTNLLPKNLPAIESDIAPEPIQPEHIEEIIDFDEIVFGVKRRQLIEYLVKQYPGKGWLLKRNNKIEGFVLVRDGYKYHHIGPLSAYNTSSAKILLRKAMESLIQQPIVVDVMCNKEKLVGWLDEMGFVKQRHFIRMFQEVNPYVGDTNRQFLICGPEFG